TKASAQHLLKERCDIVKRGCDVAFSVYKSKQQGKAGACSLDELKARDDAYTGSVEAHSVLPEWCLMQAGWTRVQATTGRRRRRRGRRSSDGTIFWSGRMGCYCASYDAARGALF